MNNKYQLSNEALSDVKNFHQYLIDENGTKTAESFIIGIFQKFHLLSIFPGMGRKRDDLSLNLFSFPDIKFKRTIFYRQRPSEIFIVRVLGSHQDHQHLFKNR